MKKEDTLEYARELADNGHLDKAFLIAERFLADDPEDLQALHVASFALSKLGKFGMAYQLAKRLTDIAPSLYSVWLNYGMVCEGLYEYRESAKAFAKGLSLAHTDREKLMVLSNLCALLVSACKFGEAEFYAKKALEIDDNDKARANLGICQLANKEWVPGWANFRKALGEYWRRRVQYGDEPEWDGSPDKTVVIYGEQGIGDEICFASMLADAIRVSKKVIVDCNPKLERLFQRSFPDAVVYGTRNVQSELPWDIEDREFDASLAIGQLGEYFRTKDEDFHGKPFLVPDEDRVLMWRALWGKKKKPIIGIGWSGGIPKTGAKFRVCDLEDWLPMFEAIDAHWVSLQYKPADRQISEFKAKYPWVDIVEYPYATLTPDYDDTAALVASLDCVVSVPTAVWHLAGGLGVPVVAMKAQVGCWKTQAGIPFHPVMKFVEWQGSWRDSITASIEPVEELCTSLSDTTQGSPLVRTSHVRASNGTLHVQ